MRIQKSIHPNDKEHYEKMGLIPNKISLWEDGARTDGSRGTYEWWYFDSHYPDGTILVIMFYSKSPLAANGPVAPSASIELTLPNGQKFSEEVTADIHQSRYTKERCNVQIGESFIKGDLTHYDIVFKGKTMQAVVALDNTVPAWRSQCGAIFFGDKEEHYFNWLPATPAGVARAQVTYSGGHLQLEGSGYHDHNWGNASMLQLMHHWYWGRAKIGPYQVISSWITAEKKYGYKEFDVFMLAKDGKILGDNANHTLRFVPRQEYIDTHTGKPIYGQVVYEYETPDGEHYRICYTRRSDIVAQRFVDTLHGAARLGAKLVGFDGAYHRFEGTATVERLENGQVVERHSEDSAVWELMYFGRSGADKR